MLDDLDRRDLPPPHGVREVERGQPMDFGHLPTLPTPVPVRRTQGS
jgi:hypothetical protein